LAKKSPRELITEHEEGSEPHMPDVASLEKEYSMRMVTKPEKSQKP